MEDNMADEQKPEASKKSKTPEAKDKPAAEPKPKASKKAKAPEPEEDLLTSAAKAIGTAAGKVATLAGVAEPAPAPKKSMKPAKLQKKNNPHLPRKLKKAQKKAAAAKARS